MPFLLIPPPAPSLPLAPAEYEQRFTEAYSTVLRLYFNRLFAAFQALLGYRGGKYLDFPYAAVQRTTDLTFTANTATLITCDTNDFINGCINDGTDGIVVEQSGIYNYQFSIQFANTDSQAHNAWVWLKKNGSDIASTGSKVDVPSKHGTSDGYLIFACNFYVSLTAGDSVSLYAAVANSLVYIEAYAAQVSPFEMPAVPAVVATLSFVSALP